MDEPPIGEGWMRVKHPPSGHACVLPDMKELKGSDDWIKDWVWRCPECGTFYTIKECMDESAFAPLWEWHRGWPWEQWRYRKMFESGQGH